MKDATRVGFVLSAGVVLIFFALVLVMAFRPNAVAGSRGLTFSLLFILLTLVVMGGYSFWRIAKLDE